MNKNLNISDDFGYWLAGFVDGEGCFSVNYNIVPGYHCIQCGISFQISLRHDDLPVLKYIKETLGIGNLTESIDNSWTNGIRKHKGNPKATYTVSTRNEVMHLIAIFEKYPLRSKKQRDFDIWKIAAKEYSINGSTRKGIFKEYSELLKKTRKYNSNIAISPLQENQLSFG